MSDQERIYLLIRCLRLELKIARLEQLERSNWPSPKKQHKATPAEIAQMRALREKGLSYNEVARRTRFSDNTARRKTKDILIEQKTNTT